MPESAPPPTMTWPKALLFSPAFIPFDILKYVFLLSWLFGPVLVGYYVSNKITDVIGTSDAAQVVAHTGAVVAGAAAGWTGAPAFIFFGTVMSVASVVVGLLVIAFVLLLFNRRIFSANIFTLPWMLFGTLVSFSFMWWVLFNNQIKKERKELRAWKQGQQNATASQQEAAERFLAQQNAMAMQKVNDNARQEAEREATEASDEIPDTYQRAA